jgi:hypothetical protein
MVPHKSTLLTALQRNRSWTVSEIPSPNLDYMSEHGFEPIEPDVRVILLCRKGSGPEYVKITAETDAQTLFVRSGLAYGDQDVFIIKEEGEIGLRLGLARVRYFCLCSGALQKVSQDDATCSKLPILRLPH